MIPRTIRSYATLPGLPERGPLPPSVGFVIPLARTNLVSNPSFETNTTGYTVAGGGSINRNTIFQYHGAYALQVIPTSTVNTGVYYAISLTAGVTYAISCKFLCAEPTLETTIAGRQHKLWIGDGSGNALGTTIFYSTGRWQWITLIYTEPTGATRRIYMTKGDTSTADSFWVDGVQCEAITDGVLSATTYIDGDQPGLLVGQQPPAYGWNGTPHASTSYRTALTRAGGYVANLQSAYNFLLTGMIGFGMATPNNISIPYSVLDGARYLRTTKPPRTISLPGRFQADNDTELGMFQSAMRAAVDRDAVPLQQPMLIYVEPKDDCDRAIGDFATVPCVYTGGLEGDQSNYPVEEAAPTFTMFVPYLLGGSDGEALTAQQTITDANAIVQRNADGEWRALGTGMSGGTPSVTALAYGGDGTLYAGGNFTDAGGSGADYLAAWNGSSWAVVKAATSITGIVHALLTGPDGRIYIGGDGTNMDGNANADLIVVYNPATDTYAALGTGGAGLGAGVHALAFDTLGNLYAGGDFTSMGGVASTNGLAKWNGSAWSSIGTVTGSINGIVSDGRGGLYVVGDFTAIGAVTADNAAHYNGTTWTALTTSGGTEINACAIGPNGDLYVVGNFTSLEGIALNYIARWNGTAWYPLGDGLTQTAFAVGIDANGIVYTGGAFTVPNSARRWNGSAWLPLDITLPGSATLFAVALAPNGTLTLGYNTAGSATAAAVVSATNSNKQYVYPTITINGPSSGTSAIYQLVNYTTGAGIYFNLTLSAGEVATLITDPQMFSFRSSARGDISGSIFPGSTPARFYLAPGENDLSFFAAGSTVSAFVSWQRRYAGYADLIN